jgi:hypothetical protein
VIAVITSIGFEVHTEVTLRITFFWVVRRQPDDSEEHIASIFMVEENAGRSKWQTQRV